jgi:LacI family transcriptional regulator
MKGQPSVDVLQSSIIDAGNNLPLHAQVRRALRQALDEHFEDGQQFWTEAVLIKQFKVSQVTVRRALSDLSSEGVLHRQVAKGTFVRKGPRNASVQSVAFKIGVFLPEWDSPVLSGMLEHLNEACWEKDCRLQVFHTRKGQKVSDAYHTLDFSPQEGGIVLYGNMQRATRELYEALQMRGYRTVNIDECRDDYPRAYIGVDNALAMKLGLEHLSKLGHRRILLMVNEPEENSAIVARREAFEATCEQMDIEGTIFHCGTRSFESSHQMAYQKMEELWAMRPHPTAIFAVSDSGALAAMRWFAERDIRVPRDVSLLGFDNDPAGSIVYPGLSTFAMPALEMARHAIETLTRERTKAEPKRGRVLQFAPRLIVRGSTAAPAIAQDKGGMEKSPVLTMT